MIQLVAFFCFAYAGCFGVEELFSDMEVCENRIAQINTIAIETQAVGGPLLSFKAKCVDKGETVNGGASS